MLYLAYYTVDFTESIDGSWIVVETGNGQVLGLAAAQDSVIYYHQCGDHYGTSFGMMGAVIPFMYRNRYADACGWRVKRDDPVVEGRKVSITNTLMDRREKGLLASLIGRTLDAVEYDSMFDCIPDRVDS